MSNVYLQVLRENRRYRHLWSAQVVSQLGDWFNSIALYTLILKLTGSSEKLGLLLVAQFLPATIGGLWLGPLVDRFPRKTLMLVCDFLRAGLALCFLAVGEPEEVYLIYVLMICMVLCRSVFEPSRKAILPDLVSSREMVAANAISGATWSSMLALGAALGGVVTGLLGLTWGFCLNSISFLVSAWFVSRIDVEEDLESQRLRRTGWGEAVSYLRAHPRAGVFALSKTFWCVGGATSLVLTLYGHNVFPLGKDGAISIGLFYACRGLGAGTGPFLAARYSGSSFEGLQKALLPGFLIGSFGYLMISQAYSLGWTLFWTVFAHLGGSIQWVFSTSLLQLSLPPEVRGRVFALEFTCLNLMVALSSYVFGVIGDRGASGPELAGYLSATMLASGLAFALCLKLTARSKLEARIWETPGEPG